MTADPRETARRIADSAIREQLIVALDHWAEAKPEKDARGRERLLTVARFADRDEWRRKLRDPALWKDNPALKLKRLAQEPEAVAQPPVTALTLAGFLWRAGARAEAVGVLRRAQQRHPGTYGSTIRWECACGSPARKRPSGSSGPLSPSVPKVQLGR
jgi:hypothetical protein